MSTALGAVNHVPVVWYVIADIPHVITPTRLELTPRRFCKVRRPLGVARDRLGLATPAGWSMRESPVPGGSSTRTARGDRLRGGGLRALTGRTGRALDAMP